MSLHPDLNIIINRLKEAELSTKRFTEVDENKKAFTPNWQLNPLDIEDLGEIKRLGVAGRDGLVLIDADKPEMEVFIEKTFPKTFATASPRRKLKHYWFKLTGEKIKNFAVFFEGLEGSLGEVRANNWYIVCPPTEITYKDLESGEIVKGNYKIINDIPIAEVSSKNFMDEFNKVLNKKKTFADIGDIGKGVSEGDRNTSALKWAKHLLSKEKLDYTQAEIAMELWNKKNKPPLENEEIKRVLSNAYRYYQQDIKEGVKYPEMVIGDKPEIELSGLGRNITHFNEDIIKILEGKDILFYRTDSRDIVEVDKIEDKFDGSIKYTGFIPVKPTRLINILEKYVVLGKNIENSKKDVTEGKPKYEFKEKSLSINDANIMLNAPILEESLSRITRIFTVPIPTIINDEITFPKQGYDSRFDSWLPYDAPTIKEPEMSLESAKKNIDKVLSEFCFKNEQDKTNAIAGLLTPMVRGLLPKFNTRTPIFAYIGNRERTGKDYLAGLTGILYEGHALEEPPISTNENARSNTSSELSKKFLSALISGRKRLHFSNNKGFINNAVLEQIATAETFSDRVLGRNDILTFDNEIDLSLSGNAGISYSPDLANRCIFINLFLDIEDANTRKFNNPDLHQTVLKGRDMLLSSLYALIRNWVVKDKPEGKTPFASFYHWAKVVGGIMECAGYNNPCEPNDINLDVGGDTATNDMKILFETIYDKHGINSVSRTEIRTLAIDLELFSFLKLDEPSGKISFGKVISGF